MMCGFSVRVCTHCSWVMPKWSGEEGGKIRCCLKDMIGHCFVELWHILAVDLHFQPCLTSGCSVRVLPLQFWTRHASFDHQKWIAQLTFEMWRDCLFQCQSVHQWMHGKSLQICEGTAPKMWWLMCDKFECGLLGQKLMIEHVPFSNSCHLFNVVPLCNSCLTVCGALMLCLMTDHQLSKPVQTCINWDKAVWFAPTDVGHQWGKHPLIHESSHLGFQTFCVWLMHWKDHCSSCNFLCTSHKVKRHSPWFSFFSMEWPNSWCQICHPTCTQRNFEILLAQMTQFFKKQKHHMHCLFAKLHENLTETHCGQPKGILHMHLLMLLNSKGLQNWSSFRGMLNVADPFTAMQCHFAFSFTCACRMSLNLWTQSRQLCKRKNLLCSPVLLHLNEHGCRGTCFLCNHITQGHRVPPFHCFDFSHCQKCHRKESCNGQCRVMHLFSNMHGNPIMVAKKTPAVMVGHCLPHSSWAWWVPLTAPLSYFFGERRHSSKIMMGWLQKKQQNLSSVCIFVSDLCCIIIARCSLSEVILPKVCTHIFPSTLQLLLLIGKLFW